MSKSQKHYKIEKYCTIRSEWHTFMQFWGMRKGFSEGAWSMLSCYYEKGVKYRYMDNEGTEIDSRHHTGINLN